MCLKILHVGVILALKCFKVFIIISVEVNVKYFVSYIFVFKHFSNKNNILIKQNLVWMPRM